ncbi:hypothetical protein BDC45DRAFT_577200 [Circinella umbellata]|nr:hypothetical protein BDC45DRAFT_577200 [Circinella umbellata]
MEAALADYRLRHNIDVGTANRYGRVHVGHYDPWITQHINDLEISLGLSVTYNEPLVHQQALQLVSSGEEFGISRLPSSAMESFGIRESTLPEKNTIYMATSLNIATLLMINRSTLQTKGAQYKFIAMRQKAAYAIVPVYTPEEEVLFNELLLKHYPEHKTKTIDYTAFAKIWSQSVDGHTIFYKTLEHMRNYYHAWKEKDNIRQSIYNNKEEINKVRDAIHSRTRKRSAPSPKQPTPTKHIRIEQNVRIQPITIPSTPFAPPISSQAVSIASRNNIHYNLVPSHIQSIHNNIEGLVQLPLIQPQPLQIYSHQHIYQPVHLTRSYPQQNDSQYQYTHPQQQIYSQQHLSQPHPPQQVFPSIQQQIVPINNNMTDTSNTNLRAGLPKYRQKSACSLCGHTNCNGKYNRRLCKNDNNQS